MKHYFRSTKAKVLFLVMLVAVGLGIFYLATSNEEEITAPGSPQAVGFGETSQEFKDCVASGGQNERKPWTCQSGTNIYYDDAQIPVIDSFKKCAQYYVSLQSNPAQCGDHRGNSFAGEPADDGDPTKLPLIDPTNN